MDLLGLTATYPRATLLIVVIFLNWAATVILTLASRKHPEGTALRERSRTALILSITLTLAFPLLLNVQFGFPWLDPEQLVWAGYVVTVLAGMPAIVWLVLYLSGKFE